MVGMRPASSDIVDTAGRVPTLGVHDNVVVEVAF